MMGKGRGERNQAGWKLVRSRSANKIETKVYKKGIEGISKIFEEIDIRRNDLL